MYKQKAEEISQYKNDHSKFKSYSKNFEAEKKELALILTTASLISAKYYVGLKFIGSL